MNSPDPDISYENSVQENERDDVLQGTGYYSLQGQEGEIRGEANVTEISVSEDDPTQDFMIQFDSSSILNTVADKNHHVHREKDHGQQVLEQGQYITRLGKAPTLTEQPLALGSLFDNKHPQSLPYATALTMLIFSVGMSSPPLALTGGLLLITTKLHYGG